MQHLFAWCIYIYLKEIPSHMYTPQRVAHTYCISPYIQCNGESSFLNMADVVSMWLTPTLKMPPVPYQRLTVIYAHFLRMGWRHYENECRHEVYTGKRYARVVSLKRHTLGRKRVPKTPQSVAFRLASLPEKEQQPCLHSLVWTITN